MKITRYQVNKMRNILTTSPKEVVDQLTKADPKNIERAIKRTPPVYCGCGAPIFEDDYDGICWNCFQTGRDEIIENENDDLIEQET